MNKSNDLSRLFKDVGCCVCQVPNCSEPVKFQAYKKMTLTDIENHLNTRDLLEQVEEEAELEESDEF